MSVGKMWLALITIFLVAAARAETYQNLQAHQASCPDARFTLAEVCAPLLAELSALGLTEPLLLSDAQSADPVLVAQLKQLVQDVQAPALELSPADGELLARVLAKHYALAPVKQRGFFDRLGDWWRSLFNSDDRNAPTFNSDFFEQLEPSEAFARFLFYLLSGLMLAFIAVHGWREVAPLLRSYQVERKKRALVAANALPAWPPELAGASPSAQMGKIYASVVAYLSQRSALPDAPSLTHAEASVEIGSARLKSELQQDFQALSQRASDSLFADAVPSAAALQESLQRANAIVQASKPSPAVGAGIAALFVKSKSAADAKITRDTDA